MLEELLKKVVTTLESKTSSMMEIYPNFKQQLLKWKNFKLHQLTTAHSILNQNISINIFDLKQQLAFLSEERFFPELRCQAILLQKQLSNHLSHQNKVIRVREDEGVRWVLERLFFFITGTNGLIKTIKRDGKSLLVSQNNISRAISRFLS